MQRRQEASATLAAIDKSRTHGLTKEELSRYDGYRGFLNKRKVKLDIEDFLTEVPAKYKEKVCRLANPIYGQGGMWGAFLELLTTANIEQVCFIVHTEGPMGTIGTPLPPIGVITKRKIFLWLIGEDLGCGHYSLLIPNGHSCNFMSVSDRDKLPKIADIEELTLVKLEDTIYVYDKDQSEKTHEFNIPITAAKSLGLPLEHFPEVNRTKNAVIRQKLVDAITSKDGYTHPTPPSSTLTLEPFTKKQIPATGDCLFDAAIQGIKILRQPTMRLTDSTPEEIIALREKVAAAMDEERISSSFRDYIFNKTIEAAEGAKARLPLSELVNEANIWRYRLSISIHASNKLRNAAKIGDCFTMQQLIDIGVDVNAQEDHHNLEKDNSRNTALHEAIIALTEAMPIGQSETILAITQAIKLLRDNGARDDIANSMKLTVQIIAEAQEIVIPPLREPAEAAAAALPPLRETEAAAAAAPPPLFFSASYDFGGVPCVIDSAAPMPAEQVTGNPPVVSTPQEKKTEGKEKKKEVKHTP